MNKQHSFLIDESPVPSPKAVVVLLGWWGASTKHLKKYAELYEAHGCRTIQVVLDPNALLFADIAAIEDCAISTIQATAQVLRNHKSSTANEKIPVLLNAYSNGGAYVLERMENFIRREQAKKDNDENIDIRLVGEHLRAEIFDSAPAYPSEEAFARAFDGVFKNAVLRFIMSKFALFAFFLLGLFCKIRGVREYRWIFWDNMIHSTLCKKEAFIYSPSDVVTDVNKLEELIAARRKKNDLTEVKRFEKSPHVLHLRTHPDEYKAFVANFLKKHVIAK